MAVQGPLGAATVRGVTSDEIRFGIAAALTGPAKDLGQQMRLGIEAAFRSENDDGGVNGRMLRLIAADDGYEPSRTGEAMKGLYEKDQVFGFIGNVGTPTAVVGAPFALERRMLFFGAFTGAGLLRRDPPDRYIFNYRPSYAEETYAVVRYLVKVRKLKPEQIAVFAQQDSTATPAIPVSKRPCGPCAAENPASFCASATNVTPSTWIRPSRRSGPTRRQSRPSSWSQPIGPPPNSSRKCGLLIPA